MLRLRSHLLWMEWTLPRCSKNTGQLVAPSTKQGRLRRRRGSIFRRFKIYFTSSSSLQCQALDWRRRSISRDFSFQSSGKIFTCHKIVHLCGNCYRTSVLSISDVYIYIWKNEINLMSQWHNFHPFLCQSKRLRWWFQCHQKLIYLIQSLTNQTSEWPGIDQSQDVMRRWHDDAVTTVNCLYFSCN